MDNAETDPGYIVVDGGIINADYVKSLGTPVSAVREFVRRLGASDERITEHVESLGMSIPYVWKFLRSLGELPPEFGMGKGIEKGVLDSLLNGLAGGSDAASTNFIHKKRSTGKADSTPPAGDSPWVPAITLWRDRFGNRKELARFRAQHPDMFQNPSKFKLEIHAPMWLEYWAKHGRAGFEALGDCAPSIADDPDVQPSALNGAMQRADELRAQKKAGKR